MDAYKMFSEIRFELTVLKYLKNNDQKLFEK